MKTFKKINCGELKVGMRFSAPVFFDDGENMFLAEGKTAKPYHIAALKRWNIPFLLTYGHMLRDGELSESQSSDDIADLEEVESLEPVGTLEAV